VAKKLACRLGRHEWTARVEEDESYKVCASCGKSPKGSRRSGSELEQSVILGGGVDEPRDALERAKWAAGGGPGP
jgi:hypothetical protein